MKKILKKVFILLIITGISYSCSKEAEISSDSDNEFSLIDNFKNHLINIETNLILKFNNDELFNKLDHSKNYEHSFYDIITVRNRKQTAVEFEKNNFQYSNPTEFDKVFIENLIKDLTENDISTFFSNIDSYHIFINNQIEDVNHKEYLTITLEQFKWIKYSIHVVNNSFDKEASEDCFDNCMETSIDNYFKDASWVTWAFFLATPAMHTAEWVGECIWDCHF